jgi:hypothetical protein
MKVKGTAYHARINLLQRKWGVDKVESFLRGFQEMHPDFPKTVLPTTWLPARQFLELIDAIVDEAYGGDAQSLWEIGDASAAWSLREGPYKNLLEKNDLERFAGLGKAMYANFFDTGEARSELRGSYVEVVIEGVPWGLRHLYFEYSLIGYFRRGLELLGASPRAECVEGFSRGDDRVLYRVHLR